MSELPRHGTLVGAKWLAFALAFAVAAIPILMLENVSLIDHPNHLARFHIAQAIGADPWLAAIYELKTGFYPYYGMELAMKALTPIMGVEWAGRVFAGLAVLMPALGAGLLSRVIHGRVSWIALAPVALSMNALVGWGFLNFVFSIGVVLAAFAAWIALGRLSLASRTALFVPVIFLTGCVHLLSAGILLGLIGAWELAGATALGLSRGMVRRIIRLIPALAALATAVALLFLITPEEGVGGSRSAWGGMVSRLEVIGSAFAMGRGRLETLLGLAAALPIYVAWREGLLVLDPRFGRMLLLVLGAALIVPVMLLGVYALHIRLPLVVALIFLAALSPRPGAIESALGKALLACFLTATALHFGVGAKILAAESRRITELRQASQVIPRGAKVLPAIDQEAALRTGLGPIQSLFHVTSFLVLDRSVFLPTLFGMYEVGVRPAYRELFPLQASPTSYADLVRPASAELARWERLEDYDYLVVLATDGKLGRPAGTRLAHAGSWFQIMQVVR